MAGPERLDPALALEQAERALAERDRRIFHLKTLYDTARELGTQSDPARILDTFLLMTMGPLGATLGLAVCMDPEGGHPRVSHRGMPPEAAAALSGGDPAVAEALFGPSCVNISGRVEISTTGLDRWPFLPEGVTALVRWCGPGEQAGLLALGRRVGQGGSAAEENEFLSRLAGILIASLKGALAEEAVRALGRDLAAKNKEYEKAIELANRARRELDRRMFHLNTLYEATNELSGIVATSGIMETFLLTAMGAFSTRQGCLYLHGDEPQLAVRGFSPGQGEREAMLALLGGFFSADGGPTSEPMSVHVLTGPKALANSAFPFTLGVAVAFSVDERTRGVVVLGTCLSEDRCGLDEVELLKALTGNFLVFLKNARYFEEVQGLNRDLTQRNEELNRLLEEVSQCKLELSDVELAKEKILEIVRRETSRSSQVRRMDFVFTLLLALLVGLVFNFSNPNGVSLLPASWTGTKVPVVDVAGARQLTLAGAVMVDARPAEFYRKGHIKGALNMPGALFDFIYSMRFATLDAQTVVMVHGRTVSRRYDEDVARMFVRRGFQNVLILDGDVEDWEDRGYPVEHGS